VRTPIIYRELVSSSASLNLEETTQHVLGASVGAMCNVQKYTPTMHLEIAPYAGTDLFSISPKLLTFSFFKQPAVVLSFLGSIR
jgi:hypothetical protein